MKKRGVSRCAALLLVLLMMMSTAVMLPSQDATAQNHEIWGFVMATDYKPLEGALVSLTDVHGLDPTQLTSGGGLYGFIVGPGFYEIEVSFDGYFSQSYGPFRFDGDKNLRIPDFILEKTPAMDWELSGTVLSSVTTQVSQEEVTFITQSMPKENVTSEFDMVLDTVNLSNPRIVYNSYTGYWNHPSNGTDNVMVEGSDYTLDLWTGIATVTNGWMASELDKGTTGSTGWIEFIYDHSDNTSYLDNQFIAAGYQAWVDSQMWDPAGQYVLDVDSGFVDIQGNFTFGRDILRFDYWYHTPIQDAVLTLYNVTKEHEVSTDTSDGSGAFTLDSWAGAFELQVRADEKQPKVISIQITGDQSMWVLLDGAITINGKVTDDISVSPVDNVRAYLLCKDSVPESIKLLEATVSGPYYEFDAYPGNFVLYVDADGYEAQSLPITVSAPEVRDFSLSLSPEELVDTSISFVGDDWNDIVVYKNLTLNMDSHIPSLGTDALGSLELEVDLTVGDGDGALAPAEWTNFTTWLTERGPQFLSTAGLFTTEAEDYSLELLGMQSRYTVTVTHDTQNVWIATESWYNTTGIALDEDTYNLELKAAYDRSIEIAGEDKILTNYTYQLALPSGYELIWNSSMNTDVIGFTDIQVDPKKGVGTGTVVMTVAKSSIGVAIVEVTGPLEGEEDLHVYYLPNNTFEEYVVIVPADTAIQFSAAKSTDPNGPDGFISENADFTWLFGDGDVGYGIAPTHNYSDPGAGSANYTVNLTIVEPGGSANTTYRDINVRVDAHVPKALVWFDNDDYEVKDSHMHIAEDIEFNFGANLSTDEMWNGEPGRIVEWEWDFDSDGDPNAFTEMVDTEFFTDPGEYVLNLTIWDWVGHKSANYSKTIYVDDVQPPDATFTLMNSTYVETNFPLEQDTLHFNASDSTDNFSTLENLTFEWSIDGASKTGVNVSYVFMEPGDKPVNLTAIDEAGNRGYHNITVSVQADPKLHSQIIAVRDSLGFKPGSPEVGQSVKINVTIANEAGGQDATNVSVRFWIIGETEDKEIGGTVKFFDDNGQIFNRTVPAGGSIVAEISWTPGDHGEYIIRANCTADNERPNADGDNSQQGTLTVKEASWVTPVIVGIFIVLIFIIAIILLFRRKFAGKFPKLSRGKKPEKEKKKKRVKK
jgi:hypothetical protein